MKRLWSLLFAASIFASGRAEEALRLVGTVMLPGVTGRFDHFAIDAAGGRLFVAALGNNTVEVIDVLKNRRVTSIAGLRKPTGVVFVPGKNEIGVAAGAEGVFKVFSGTDYKLVATVSGLDDADNVRLDRQKGKAFVGYGDGALAVLDTATWKKTGDIALAGHPESFQLNDHDDLIYVNVPGSKQVAVADSAKGRVAAHFAMGKFQSNFPMALDEANNRLFIGCRKPPRMVAIDTRSGKELFDLEISSDTDDLFHDGKRNRIYVSCGEGFVDVISSAPGQPLKQIAKIATRSGARTAFYSRDLDKFFLAVPNRGSEPAEIRIYQPSQP